MPSAASVKLDKPPTNNSAVTVAGKETIAAENVDNSSPIRQVIVIIDHKIRNLEKRKGKLESYRDIEKSGKELSADQKVAVSKYDEVAMTLDFAREFSKQIIQIASVSERDLKKKQKKDETSKKQGETSKIREVLIIQDVLSQLANEIVRNDFLAGANGACKLEESDLKLLDQFHEKITPKRPSEANGIFFKSAAQKSADHLALTIDGKQKEFEDSTYANVKTILKNIQKCTYFDVVDQKSGQSKSSPVESLSKEDDGSREESEIDADLTKRSEETLTNDEAEAKIPEFQEAPAAAAVPVPSFPPQQLNANAPSVVPTQPNAPGETHPLPMLQALALRAGPTGALPMPGQQLNHPIHGQIQPTTVHDVDPALFKMHQYMEKMRPFAQLINAGEFFFLQDSELDSPDVTAGAPGGQGFQPTPQNPNGPIQVQPNIQVPLQQQPQQIQQHPTHIQASSQSQIPSQTFTNQSFPNVVYANIKPQPVNDLSIAQVPAIQQPQIPGFATPNAPIPIPIVQSTVAIPVASVPINPTSSSSVLPVAGKHVSPVATVGTGVTTQSIPSSNIMAANAITKGLPAAASMPTVESIEQHVREINEWKPDDASHPPIKTHKSKGGSTTQKGGAGNKDAEGNSEWRESFSYAATTANTNQEGNEWNGVSGENSPDEANAWTSGGNQRYQYRLNSGRYNRSNRSEANVRNGNGGTRNNSTNVAGNTGSTVSSGGGTTNGYRGGGRPNSSYQSNNGGGRNSSGGANNGTYYRNNDTYYQNGSGNGNHGNYRDKPDNYTRPNSYRSRDSRDTRENRDTRDARDVRENATSNVSSFKNGGAQSLPQRNNSHGNATSNNGNRLNANAADNGDRAHANTNNQNQSQSRSSRPVNASNKGQSSAAGGANSGGSRTQQSAPINA